MPGFSGIVDYFWHGGSDATANFGTWNRIIAGSSQGLDYDIADAGVRNMNLGMSMKLLCIRLCVIIMIVNLRVSAGHNTDRLGMG